MRALRPRSSMVEATKKLPLEENAEMATPVVSSNGVIEARTWRASF